MKDALKRKVTVTLAPQIVQALDEKARAGFGGSRSAALSALLEEWNRQEAVRQEEAAHLQRETAAYYQSQSRAEREEDEDWAAFAARAAVTEWPAE